MAGSIYVPLLSSFNPAGVNNARKSLGGLGTAFDGVKRAVGLASAGFVAFRAVSETIDFGRSSVTAARDLESNLIGLESIFGSLAPRMEQFGKNAVNIGLSQNQAAKASTFIGSVLKQAGFSMEDVAGQTENLVAIASDLAFVYNYDVSEALSGITALFRGEYDPIEKFGVALKQNEVNALVAAKGLGHLTGQEMLNAQQTVRMEQLFLRSADAAGAFAAQSGTLFAEQKKLNAVFENLQANVGLRLTPAIANLMSQMRPLVSDLGPGLTHTMDNIGNSIEGLSPVPQPATQQPTHYQFQNQQST